MIGGFSNEDVNSSDRDDRNLGRVRFRRNPALVRRNEGETSIILDASNGDGSADACKGGIRPVPASRRRRPHGGRQLSLH